MTTQSGAVALMPIGEIERMARAICTSKLFGIKNIEEAVSLMLIEQAEGRHPALAARDYDIIQGRPAKKAEAMMRDFLESGGKVEWHALDDKIADATFSHPQGGSARIEWTMERAKTAGFGSKDMYKKFPRQMLRSRVVSEGVRTVCPMATSGMYVPEEVQDFEKPRKEKELNPITPNAGAGDSLSPERIAELDAVVGNVYQWIADGSLEDAFLEYDNASAENDDKNYMWSKFDSALRRKLKEEGARQREKNAAKTALPAPAASSTPNLISEAQRKRLEARIGELKLDRELVKTRCAEWFGKEHFAELDQEEYSRLDQELETMKGA